MFLQTENETISIDGNPVFFAKFAPDNKIVQLQ